MNLQKEASVIGRVCLVRQSIYPFDLLARREAETLSQAGLETHVICLEKLDVQDRRQLEETINGVHVHRLPLKKKRTGISSYVFDYLSFALLAAVRLTVMHLRQPFDVVQVNTMPDFLAFATILPKILGAKVVCMMYEPTPELWEDRYKSRPPRFLSMVEQLVLAYVDRSFTVTQQLKNAYVERGADPGKIQVVLNVPDASFLEVAGDQGVQPPDREEFVLICHGTIEERYGHDTILEAVALVRSQIPRLRVRILGRGNYLDEFLAKRKALALEDCVDFLGYVPLEQMVQELRAADVGIVAQKSSPYSNLVHTGKMYEYIALGKPVLASRLKAVEAYFGDDAVAYFESGDAQSLANGILDLYRHPEKRRALAGNARVLYDRYCWEKQKETYLSTYEQFFGLSSLSQAPQHPVSSESSRS